jgi:hypothetical protein
LFDIERSFKNILVNFTLYSLTILIIIRTIIKLQHLNFELICQYSNFMVEFRQRNSAISDTTKTILDINLRVHTTFS